MRIAVLFNDRLGIPALQFLAQNRLLTALGTSDASPEMVAIMQQVSTQAHVPAQVFTRNNFESTLLAWLEQHKPDVVLVKTFPFRIPAGALHIPKHGFINFHYAPLPAYRGSNPLFWMVREGVTVSGVTVHRMNEKFDAGPILLQQAVTFPPDATFGICSTVLAYAGAQLTQLLLGGLQNNTITETPQETPTTRWYGRPEQKDLFISWITMDAQQVKALAKACNPWLKGAPTRFNGWAIGITDASVSDFPVPEGTLPGTILRLSAADGCIIVCKNGTALRADVVYTEEGFFTGSQLLQFGLKEGNRLG
jgi:methionyl-tRNA formyltransferase